MPRNKHRFCRKSFKLWNLSHQYYLCLTYLTQILLSHIHIHIPYTYTYTYPIYISHIHIHIPYTYPVYISHIHIPYTYPIYIYISHIHIPYTYPIYIYISHIHLILKFVENYIKGILIKKYIRIKHLVKIDVFEATMNCRRYVKLRWTVGGMSSDPPWREEKANSQWYTAYNEDRQLRVYISKLVFKGTDRLCQVAKMGMQCVKSSLGLFETYETFPRVYSYWVCATFKIMNLGGYVFRIGFLNY